MLQYKQSKDLIDKVCDASLRVSQVENKIFLPFKQTSGKKKKPSLNSSKSDFRLCGSLRDSHQHSPNSVKHSLQPLNSNRKKKNKL